MTNPNKGVCVTTCCGSQPGPVYMRSTCSPKPVAIPTEEEKEDNLLKVKCYEEDIVSLPEAHDVYCDLHYLYCKKERIKKEGPPPRGGKPKITVKNEFRLKQKEEDAFFVLRQMLQIYKQNEIMFAFNGGKDCTVVLDLLGRLYKSTCLTYEALPVLYIYSDDSFPEVNEFVDACSERYYLELFKYNGNMKEGLTKMLKEYKKVKACVMGLRSTDPYCENLKIMQYTDPDWPPLMRINPILDWTYCDVWNYIVYYELPYCPLYNQGYTSLGNRSNTFPNQLLKCKQPTCKDVYFPAYELIDGSMERAGRISLSAGGFKKPPQNVEDNPES